MESLYASLSKVGREQTLRDGEERIRGSQQETPTKSETLNNYTIKHKRCEDNKELPFHKVAANNFFFFPRSLKFWRKKYKRKKDAKPVSQASDDGEYFQNEEVDMYELSNIDKIDVGAEDVTEDGSSFSEVDDDWISSSEGFEHDYAKTKLPNERSSSHVREHDSEYEPSGECDSLVSFPSDDDEDERDGEIHDLQTEECFANLAAGASNNMILEKKLMDENLATTYGISGYQYDAELIRDETVTQIEDGNETDCMPDFCGDLSTQPKTDCAEGVNIDASYDIPHGLPFLQPVQEESTARTVSWEDNYDYAESFSGLSVDINTQRCVDEPVSSCLYDDQLRDAVEPVYDEQMVEGSGDEYESNSSLSEHIGVYDIDSPWGSMVMMGTSTEFDSRSLAGYKVWFRHTGMELPDEWMDEDTREYTLDELKRETGGHKVTHMVIESSIPPDIHLIAPELTHLRLRGIPDNSNLSNMSKLNKLEVLWMSCNNFGSEGIPDIFTDMVSMKKITYYCSEQGLSGSTILLQRPKLQDYFYDLFTPFDFPGRLFKTILTPVFRRDDTFDQVNGCLFSYLPSIGVPERNKERQKAHRNNTVCKVGYIGELKEDSADSHSDDDLRTWSEDYPNRQTDEPDVRSAVLAMELMARGYSQTIMFMVAMSHGLDYYVNELPQAERASTEEKRSSQDNCELECYDRECRVSEHSDFEDEFYPWGKNYPYDRNLDKPWQPPKTLHDAVDFDAPGSRAYKTDELQEVLKGLKSDYRYLAPAQTDLWCYTVPRYPDNHNPLLPLSLQKKLDDMPPREYLTYVLRELTLEERESLMVDERQRRKTFLVNWPRENNLSGVKMAQAGFYCVDNFDRVQCVFCRGSLHRWEPEDNPMTEHARSFTFCRFVKGLECGNREYKSDVLTADELKNIMFYGQPPEMKRNRDGSVSTDSRVLGISTNRADTVQYAPEPTRLKTFARWPASSPITAKRLCVAGFYFTGFDDQVRCFYCSGSIREWRENDDPWEEHARWFPECSYLLQQKGEDYIADVHARTPANKKCTRATVSQKRAETEQKQLQTNHQAMVSFCRKMGHSLRDINEAVRRNGGPFSKPDKLIDAIYSLTDGFDSGFQDGDMSDYVVAGAGACAAPRLTDQPVSVPEADIRRHRLGDFDTDSVDGVMDTTLGRKAAPGTCILCFRKANRTETATQIGLPCGHVIYCERCSREEKVKVDRDRAYKSRCPFDRCGAPLTGSFRFFFN